MSLLRLGEAGGNTVAGHITAAQLALAQPPKPYGTHAGLDPHRFQRQDEFVAWLADCGRWLSHLVG